MGLRFHKSFGIIPGLRINLSKSGLSASFGGAPFTINAGQRGIYATASVPGTGISFRQRIGGGHRDNPTQNYQPENYPQESYPQETRRIPAASEFQEVRSASTESLTSEGLKELKTLIQQTHQNHEAVTKELSIIQPTFPI